jgi:hypothetical protein
MSKQLTKHINVILPMYEQLAESLSPDSYGMKLASGVELVPSTLPEELDETQEDLAFGLIEYESGHTGQLLLCLFALTVEIPRLWVKYFALDQ